MKRAVGWRAVSGEGKNDGIGRSEDGTASRPAGAVGYRERPGIVAVERAGVRSKSRATTDRSYLLPRPVQFGCSLGVGILQPLFVEGLSARGSCGVLQQLRNKSRDDGEPPLR